MLQYKQAWAMPLVLLPSTFGPICEYAVSLIYTHFLTRYLTTSSLFNPWQMISHGLSLLALLSKETGIMSIPINVAMCLILHPAQRKHRSRDLNGLSLRIRRLALDTAVITTLITLRFDH